MRSALRVAFVSIIALFMLNVIAFAIPFTKEHSFWIANAFALISIALTITVSVSANSSKKSLRSRFYGWQLISVVAVYLILQLVLSIVFMAIPSIPAWVTLTVCILLLGFCLLGLLAGTADNSAAEHLDEQATAKVGYLRMLHNDLLSVVSNCSNKELRYRIEQLAEAIRYSDPMSASALTYIENNIRAKCSEIRTAVANGNLEQADAACREASILLDERNRLCLEMK